MFLVLGSISLCLGCLCLYGVCGIVVLVVVFGAVDWICMFVGLRFKALFGLGCLMYWLVGALVTMFGMFVSGVALIV